MRNNITVFIMLFCVFSAFGQKKLLWEELPVDIPFSTEKQEALVVLVHPENMKLIFETGRSEPIDVFKREKVDTDSVIYIGVPVGDRWENRKLNITVPNYVTLGIPVRLLEKGDVRKFRINNFTEPHMGECWSGREAQGDSLFMAGNYLDAAMKYKAVRVCPEYRESAALTGKIALTDSLLYLKNQGDAYFRAANYDAAIAAYQQIVNKNEFDSEVMNKLADAQVKKQEKDCNSYFAAAENFYNQKDFVNAKTLYKQVADLSCDHSVEAKLKLRSMNQNSFFTRKGERPFVLLYEYKGNNPIGLTYGTYYTRRGGAYISLNTNPAFFEALRSNYREQDKPEINASVGGTFKIVLPVWMFVGAGYTGVGKYYREAESNGLKMDFYNAISPEVGLLCKIGPVALRYTFQYRFAFNHEHAGWIGRIKHAAGLGICF